MKVENQKSPSHRIHVYIWYIYQHLPYNQPNVGIYHTWILWDGDYIVISKFSNQQESPLRFSACQKITRQKNANREFTTVGRTLVNSSLFPHFPQVFHVPSRFGQNPNLSRILTCSNASGQSDNRTKNPETTGRSNCQKKHGG